MRHVLAALVLATGAVTGCVSSIEPDVALQMTPSEDNDYGPTLERSTRTRTIFKDFETRWMMSATYLSPEFRAAFARRLARVYKNAPMQFEEAQSKAGFFVSVDAPMADRVELGNPHHWSILLNDGATTLKPVLVKKLDDKERWRAFFDTVTEWTTEYLVIFDAPSVTPNAKDLVAKSGMSVTFANADAQLNLIW